MCDHVSLNSWRHKLSGPHESGRGITQVLGPVQLVNSLFFIAPQMPTRLLERLNKGLTEILSPVALESRITKLPRVQVTILLGIPVEPLGDL